MTATTMHTQAPHEQPRVQGAPASARSALPPDEQRWADTTAAIQGLAATLAQVDARLAALEADGLPDIRSDLYRRLTSRPLWTAFILPALCALAAALAGELSWMQAAAVMLGGGSVFGVVEGARDVAARRTRPAYTPEEPRMLADGLARAARTFRIRRATRDHR